MAVFGKNSSLLSSSPSLKDSHHVISHKLATASPTPPPLQNRASNSYLFGFHLTHCFDEINLPEFIYWFIVESCVCGVEQGRNKKGMNIYYELGTWC